MEDVAEGYWKELVQRSLLQVQTEWYDCGVCKMHNLLHSLARHLASNECLCAGDLREFSGETISCSSRSMNLHHI